MTVVFFILVLLVLLGAKITPLHSQPSYLRYQQTLGVKGLFIALIVLSHFSAYRDDASWSQFDHIFVFIRTYLGQMTVAPFLFLSGYGVTLSIIKKGKAYLDTMAVKRIGLVMFQFLCMVALNWAISLPLGNQASLQQVLYSFVGAAEMGDNRWYGYSNWYIVVIVLLYALTWLSFLWAKGDIRKGCIALTVSAFLLTLYLGWTKLDYWHNTLPAYIGGGWFAVYQPSIDAWMEKVKSRFPLVLAILTASYLILHEFQRNSVWVYRINSIVFAFLVVAVCTRIQIRNPLLCYCGKHVFSLYTLQRLAAGLVYGIWNPNENYSAFIVASSVLLVAMSAAFDAVVPRIYRWLQKKMMVQQTV